MQGLQQFIAFAQTARYGGFAAAARAQGVAPSTLAKAVARLEAVLGVKLFHRTTRQVTLTPDGERLFERCQRVLDEVESLQAEASGTRGTPTGVLRIDLPVFYGKRFVMPLLAQLLQQHPALQLDLRLTDLQVDLVREGVDLAVRIGQLRDSTLVARRVDQQGLVLCASAAYLARRGTPRRVDDLHAHDAVVFRVPSTGRDRPWHFRQRGVALEHLPRAHVRVNETEGLLEALKLGLGLCQVPDLLVQDELARGELVELLPACRPPSMPIHIVYPSNRLLPSRVKAAIEALEALRGRG
ncbi:LysR substrate-binding domain-containing protein [Paucibacter sediminis]|uniref:LysR substrate-binding domain-containing protein n=1 Tax=Paucibacter sediminis TaxID=3019553 RepID=A0AA95NG36_9BURK|nr:LysR family transcriptional regulator [Paucibacter sp. S2-9]WIT13629.1 LysR substrate-binding domain-containing protein [Paucibacter sp. S2-9]